MCGNLFVVCGPSGVGKTSLVALVLELLEPFYRIERIKTYTTRKPRGGRYADHPEYVFVPEVEFRQKVDAGFFLEWVEYCDNLYGSPADVFRKIDNGVACLLVLDIEGAKRVRQRVEQAITIWLYPPDMAKLEQNILKRGSESKEAVRRRLLRAEAEMQEARQVGLFDYLVCSDDLDETASELAKIVVDSIECTRRT